MRSAVDKYVGLALENQKDSKYTFDINVVNREYDCDIFDSDLFVDMIGERSEFSDVEYYGGEFNITDEQNVKFELYNNTMEKIENKLKDKHLSKFNTLGEVIYLFSLSDKSEEKDFVKNFVSCFKKNSTNEDVINAVNSKFKTNVDIKYINKMIKSTSGSKISLSGYYDPKVKNNLDLAEWCRNAQKNGWGYVYGGYGQICTLISRLVLGPAIMKPEDR